MKNSVWFAVIASFGLLLSPKTSAYPEQYIIRSDYWGEDKWFGTHYHQNGRNDEILKIGGWGDAYFTLIQMPIHFRVPGLTVIRGATLNLESYSSFRPTAMRKFFVLDNWSETSTSDQWDLDLLDLGTLVKPPLNGPYTIDISGEFLAWLFEDYENNGILLSPTAIDNNFNTFLSSENARTQSRPSIVVTYEKVPHLKMPLPGGNYWKCTTSAGGSSGHQGRNYYSLDLSYRHYDSELNLIQNITDIPILAAGDGVVIQAGYTSLNGNYVFIDHDKDGNIKTGYQTVYLHMKNNSLTVSVGDVVCMGDQLGIMDDEGLAEGVHLHFQVYFEHEGSMISNGDNVFLNNIFIEGRLITEFSEGIFYESKNSPIEF